MVENTGYHMHMHYLYRYFLDITGYSKSIKLSSVKIMTIIAVPILRCKPEASYFLVVS